jgi:hypothetical protein
MPACPQGTNPRGRGGEGRTPADPDPSDQTRVMRPHEAHGHTSGGRASAGVG